MSWRDSLRPGSFRGAAFKIQTGEKEGGRRGELHEFPERDNPWFEDLGRKARQWTVDAIVVGPDYMAERDALDAACEQEGPGTLVHPFLGELTVVCLEHRYRESTTEGGAAFFSITFAEPGEPAAAETYLDTAAQAVATADAAQELAPERFAASFSVAGMPSFVEASAAGQVRALAEYAAGAAIGLGGAGIALRAYESGLSALPNGAIALVRAPLSLGHAVVGVVMAVAGLTASPISRVRALRQLLGSGTRLPPFIGVTPARIREQSNTTAFVRLVAVITAAEMVRAASSVRFASYDEAVALRDSLSEAIDAASVEAADAGDDDNAGTLDRLRLVMIRDITARGGSLDRLSRYTPEATEPALVIAQRLYGDTADVVAEAEAIADRNRIAHPGFVVGGRALQIRAVAGGGRG